MHFAQKVEKITSSNNTLLCVGLDPSLSMLPKKFLEKREPLFEFCKWIVEQTHEFTGVYKIQFAYFEALGTGGYAQLEKVLQFIKANYPEHLIIADAKRADIADTSQAYATSIFDYLNCDAVTLHPYLGQDALQPFLERSDKGSIILCRTSNPGAGELQDVQILLKHQNPSNNNQPNLNVQISNPIALWEYMAHKVAKEWNRNNNCMLVVGATYPQELQRVRKIVGDMWLLIPGIGAQGGDLKQVMQAGLNQDKQGLLISASRSIIFSPDPREEAKKLRDDINRMRNLST